MSNVAWPSVDRIRDFGEKFYIDFDEEIGNFEVGYVSILATETIMEMSADGLQETTHSIGVIQGCESAYTAPTFAYSAPPFGAFDGSNLYLDVQQDITFAGANDGDCSFNYTFTLTCNYGCGATTESELATLLGLTTTDVVIN